MNGDLYYLAAIAGKPLPCAKPARRDTAGGGAGVLRARNVLLIVRPAMDRSDPSSQADPATADGPLAGPLAGLACWVVPDGKAGMDIQCLGLAEPLGLPTEGTHVTVRQTWRGLPAGADRPPTA